MVARLRIYALSLLAISSSCSAPNPYKGSEFSSAREGPAQPLSFRVQVLQERAAKPDQIAPLVLREEKKVEIVKAVANSLEEYRAVSRVCWDEGPPPNDCQAPADAVIRLTIKWVPPADLNPLGEAERNNLIYPNLFLWLLAGFPGWILSDVDFQQGLDIKYTVLRLPDETALFGPIDLARGESLNFLRRATLWHYALQIIVPPFLIPPHEEKAGESLFANFLSSVQKDIGKATKEKLLDAQIARRGSTPLLLVSPRSNPTGGEAALILLSTAQPQLGKAMVLPPASVAVPAPDLVWKALVPDQLVWKSKAMDDFHKSAFETGPCKLACDKCNVCKDEKHGFCRELYPYQNISFVPKEWEGRLSIPFPDRSVEPWTWTVDVPLHEGTPEAKKD